MVLGAGGMLGEILKQGSSLYTRLVEQNEHIAHELSGQTASNKSIFRNHNDWCFIFQVELCVMNRDKSRSIRGYEGFALELLLFA